MIPEIGGDIVQWLRGFYYVVTSGSFSAAALIMRRNQPTISHQIKSLEDELGVQLLERGHNSIQLTDAGKVVFEEAKAILENVQNLKKNVQNIHNNLDGQIKMALAHTVMVHFLAPYICEMHHTYPDITYEFSGGGTRHILEKIDSNEVDFGIVDLVKPVPGFIYKKLFKAEHALLVGKNSPFTLSKNPTLQEIAGLPFISFPFSSSMTRHIMAAFEQEGLSPRTVMVQNNVAVAKTFVQDGIGVVILEEFALMEQDYKDFVVYPMEKFISPRSYVVIIKKNRIISPEVRALLALLNIKV